jgi:hypothetical protein
MQLVRSASGSAPLLTFLQPLLATLPVAPGIKWGKSPGKSGKPEKCGKPEKFGKPEKLGKPKKLGKPEKCGKAE